MTIYAARDGSKFKLELVKNPEKSKVFESMISSRQCQYLVLKELFHQYSDENAIYGFNFENSQECSDFKNTIDEVLKNDKGSAFTFRGHSLVMENSSDNNLNRADSLRLFGTFSYCNRQ